MGCKGTRSHVCCLGPVCGFRSAKHERLGTRWCTERAAESCMHSQIISTLFGTFLFQICYRREQPAHHPIQRSRRSMEPLNESPEASAMAAPRSRSRSPEAARRHLPSTPICVTETAKVVTTPPDIVSDVDSSCSACLAPSWRLKHTCTKARSQNKRNASPAVEARHAKRSGTAGVYALMACEGFQGEGSASAIGSLTDVRCLRPVERHVPSPPHHPSSSQEPPPPTRPPSPVLSPTFEQRDPVSRSRPALTPPLG